MVLLLYDTTEYLQNMIAISGAGKYRISACIDKDHGVFFLKRVKDMRMLKWMCIESIVYKYAQ